MAAQDRNISLTQTSDFILEPDGPIRFVRIAGIEGRPDDVWVPPEDAFMLQQHQCSCGGWEEWEICVSYDEDGECKMWKTVRKCVEWHCHENGDT